MILLYQQFLCNKMKNLTNMYQSRIILKKICKSVITMLHRGNYEVLKFRLPLMIIQENMLKF